jgi:hypothetical protein
MPERLPTAESIRRVETRKRKALGQKPENGQPGEREG